MKRGRKYDGGPGYAGATCERAGVEPGVVYKSKEQAQKDAQKLTEYNQVGFEVVSYHKVKSPPVYE